MQLTPEPSRGSDAKNILMIGWANGRWKNREIARRLAKLADAPFLKLKPPNSPGSRLRDRDVET